MALNECGMMLNEPKLRIRYNNLHRFRFQGCSRFYPHESVQTADRKAFYPNLLK